MLCSHTHPQLSGCPSSAQPLSGVPNLPATVYETTVNSDVSNLVLMKRVSVRLYWVAVACNMLALGILLRGVLVPLGREAQVLAVMLTAISMICWLAYFQKLNK
jgi:hypothetical protein